ncbi:hypothetical protein Kisp01_69050 [Kineosporia sp. NBRC 101677]|uniref:hypothetical protein n=1 Tax=Kineosporia sp. NBRC 101677 TaxID=3032197 RepID=UPI0024A476B7|nr:hypothetical protein [Kineosporia sp. NBRC 101677]GLY19891.1 hypothetical protein Kisp01_69050 [Kineosporia sp. NBRC 101677]
MSGIHNNPVAPDESAALDPRLRTAIDASISWYEDLCALHGVGSVISQGVWSSLSAPPPLHSDAVALEPEVTAELIEERLKGRMNAGVKDSFAALDLSSAGMRILFSATWIYRRPAPVRSTDPGPSPWTRVRTDEQLAEWTALHDTTEVLLPGLLQRGAFAVLARRVDGRIVAGAVARLGSGAVDVSNTYAVEGHVLDWAELADAVAALFPDRPMVGYERGAPLRAALAGGFEAVGDLRVWVR